MKATRVAGLAGIASVLLVVRICGVAPTYLEPAAGHAGLEHRRLTPTRLGARKKAA
jgi:hypothetical protein